MTETGFLLTLGIDLLSLALVALALTDVWQGRAGGKSILPALVGGVTVGTGGNVVAGRHPKSDNRNHQASKRQSQGAANRQTCS